MPSAPRVSVIIPTYNRAEFLKEAIDSVLAQSYQDFELLIVDDGSDDHTRRIVGTCSHYVKYFHQSNKGVSSARNLGIRASQGQFIAFLDSDDLWHPFKLARQVEILQENPDLQLCHTEEIWIRRGVRVNQKKKHAKYGGYIFPYCLPLCVISPSSVMIRRTLFDQIGVFDEQLPACEDYDLWLRICCRYPVCFLETPLITKRGGHEDQLSRKYWGLDRFRVQALRKLLEHEALTKEQHELARTALCRKCEILAAGSLKRQKMTEWKHYCQLIEHYSRPFLPGKISYHV
ncbi:glycosyl transferase [candidate division KSB3 bacterium]|uniref:Glycosyl transferase n=1 Tax=candidate division KSB3 bacterium TaxID=2044937 RepID=A0A2G6E400_9BACT|nr:MAG: glycosyl transferase [candidate division KSB3 bacterium]PIE29336.1 MAG: glycosyl transferase [candidate division KSB3 bacterium]